MVSAFVCSRTSPNYLCYYQFRFIFGVVMSEQRLLRIMADGDYHSGEELGESLGVSRTAVWKQIKKLEGLGLNVDSVKGRGYRIPGGVDLLSEQQLLSSLSDGAKECLDCVEVLSVVDSTNALAMGRAQTGIQSYLCVAEQQTAGRGRRGRVWQSPYGRNLYFSVVWSFQGGASVLEGLSLAVGVGVVNALSQLGVEGLGVKWPNDILYKDKKLAGILLEMTGDAEGPCKLVVGIGLNVSMAEAEAKKIDQDWINLSDISADLPSRNQILAAIINELMPILASYEEKGFSAYRQQFMALDAYSDRPVYIRQGARVVVGRVAGVDEAGALLMATDDGVEVFNGGEVSLRRLNDS